MIFIDATNIGGGGGVTHLMELIGAGQLPCPVTIIAQKKVLVQIPDCKQLTKINHPLLEKTLLHRVFFQVFVMDRLIPAGAVVFAVSGDYLGRHQPVISMSQNMLLYERDIWKEIKSIREVARFFINFHKQKRSFKNSSGVIFLSGYAREYISARLNLKGKQVTVIHHGVSPRFFGEVREQRPISSYSHASPFRFTYVSTVHVYKNQWNVVEAMGALRKQGYPVELHLVGGVIFKPAGDKLQHMIRTVDPNQEFIHFHGDIPYNEVDKVYESSDGIIFASTCENMPNILLESMASGIPVACSNKAPMPEFLKEHGFYFDAHDVGSIVSTLSEMLDSPETRALHAMNARQEASAYTWQDTSNQTFNFLLEHLPLKLKS